MSELDTYTDSFDISLSLICVYPRTVHPNCNSYMKGGQMCLAPEVTSKCFEILTYTWGYSYLCANLSPSIRF